MHILEYFLPIYFSSKEFESAGSQCNDLLPVLQFTDVYMLYLHIPNRAEFLDHVFL